MRFTHIFELKRQETKINILNKKITKLNRIMKNYEIIGVLENKEKDLEEKIEVIKENINHSHFMTETELNPKWRLNKI